jgi:hypothetical protein
MFRLQTATSTSTSNNSTYLITGLGRKCVMTYDVVVDEVLIIY